MSLETSSRFSESLVSTKNYLPTGYYMYCIHILRSTPYLTGTAVLPWRGTGFRFWLPPLQKKNIAKEGI